jgi:hypothetical protein
MNVHSNLLSLLRRVFGVNNQEYKNFLQYLGFIFKHSLAAYKNIMRAIARSGGDHLQNHVQCFFSFAEHLKIQAGQDSGGEPCLVLGTSLGGSLARADSNFSDSPNSAHHFILSVLS